MFGKIYGFTLLALAVTVASAKAQTGIYPFGSFDTVGADTIDRGSLNVHVEIPVVSKRGRGVGFQYTLVYDGLVWTPQGTTGSQTWTPAVGFGLHGQFNEGYEGYISYDSATFRCTLSGTVTYVPYYVGYVYHDPFGVSHPLPYTYNACGPVITGATLPALDSSGYIYNGVSLLTRDGKILTVPLNSQSSSGSLTDSNGNSVSNNGNGTFTDTLGKTALTIAGSGTPSSPKTFQYSTPTGTATATVAYETYTVQTAFNCTGVTEYNLSQNLPSTITLADGSVYTFKYEKTPGGTSSQVTGRLASLGLPQGGTVTYAYTGANDGIVCADGTPTGLTRSGGVGRTYVRSAITSGSSETTITDGLSNTSVYNFVIAAGSPEAFYETNRSIYQGSASGTAVLSRQTCYDGKAPSCLTTAVSLPITQIDTYEALNSSGLHGSTLTYNSYGLETAETDYDFGGSARGAVLRQETWTYPTSGIPSLVSTDTVTDGTNRIGLTGYLYDETSGTGHAALVATSGLPRHGTVSGQRGNLTTIQQYPNSGTSYLYTAAAYEDTGNALTVTAPSGVSSYAYDATTHAFTITATPPTPSSGVSLPSSATYDPNSGMPLTSVDPNSQAVTYKSYDPLLRPTEIDYPDGGKMVASYTYDQTGVYHYMTASTHTNTQTNLDGYGRLNWVSVENASGGYYSNNYCYDGNGNVQFASYRFVPGTFVCSGTGGDTSTYDALGRVLKITHGDTSKVTYSYNERATEVTDENLVSRIVQVDGLGRTTAVCEITGTALQGVSPVNCNLDITGTGFLTTYAYSTDTSKSNALKVAVTQGAQTRTFETDSLGRTISVVEPESGSTTYSYAYSTTSGLGLTVTRVRPQANQTGSAQTTTTTQYDSVGRVVSVNYSDSTANRLFGYDTNCCWPQTPTNIKGRLATTGGGSGATWNGSVMSYDVMGRVINMWACAPATCGTSYQSSRPLSFAYDWAGNLTQESDTASGTINYGRSIAGEVTSITNATYQNLPYNPPNLVSNVVNGPDGPVSYTLGNGLTGYRSYDSLGRLSGQWVCNGPAAAECSGGTQIYGTTSAWKGVQMQEQNDTVLNQQVTLGYDGFNRLTARTVTSGTVQNYTYAYDRYGNRWQTALQTGYNFNPTYSTTTNHITSSGYTYDAAGNMTNDTFHTYTYDAEGNITQVDGGSTATYVYDVFNHRIHVQTASATTEFIYDYAGRRVSSWLSPNNLGNEGRIYWDGQQFAYRSTDGTTYFDHQDLLGTERLRSNYAGSVGSSYISLPWGDGYTAAVNSSGADQDNAHFADLERDAESGTEHAQFRNYTSRQGRWLSPDPYLGSYDATNPQSMNRYAYVLNNPTSMFDPSGLNWQFNASDGCWDWGASGVVSGVDTVSVTNGCSANPGCIAYGTEGCIQAPISVPVAPGEPGSGPGAAPNNAKQITTQCVAEFNNSGFGGAVNFLSMASPLIGPDRLGSTIEDVGGSALKFGAYQFFRTASQTMVRTPFGSMSGFVSETIEAVAKDAVFPAAAAATGVQILVHAGCANSGANATGQANIPANPGYF